jgi:hypothetical protein
MSSADLRILPITKIIPHEGYDPCRVRRLVRSFQMTNILFEPLIVTEHHGSFILLDGATRTQAFKELSISQAAVQVVRYRKPDVQLQTWNHVILDIPTSALLSELEAKPGFSTEPSFEFPNAALDLDGAVAQIITPSGECFRVINSNPGLGIAWVLNQIVDIYRGSARVYRSTQLNQQLLRESYPGFYTAIKFPRFHPSDVIEGAVSGDHFPMGITRHIIAERVKNLNLPLNILRGRCSSERYSQASQHRDTERLVNQDMEHRDSTSIFP